MVETLAIEIINNKTIEGIFINNREIKLTQLADDTTLFLKNTKSLQCSLNILENFNKCSGLKLNYTKTDVLPIGETENLDKYPVKVDNKACCDILQRDEPLLFDICTSLFTTSYLQHV